MAVIAKQRYKLDIAPKGGWVVVYVSQHDDGAREIEFEITNQGNAFSIPASINVSVQGIKSNKSYFSHSCSYSGNVVTMALADDMTDVIGKAICVLKFTNSSQQKLATAKFILNVDSDSSSEGVIIDTDAEEIFNQMLNDIRAQAASISADIAELQSMVGSPLVASTASAMTDHNKIYVYTGSESGYINGNWYYWNGSTWTSGGVYNAVAFETDKTLSVENMAADAKVVGDKIDTITSNTKNLFNPEWLLEASGWMEQGGIYSGTARSIYDKYKVAAEPIPFVGFEENARYTFSMYAKVTGNAGSGSSLANQCFRLRIAYSDGTTGSILGVSNTLSDFTKITGTTAEGKTVSAVNVSYGAELDNTLYIKEIQCEKSAVETEYISFITAKDGIARESVAETNSIINNTINSADLFYSENYESSLWRQGWWGASTGNYDSAHDNAICLYSYIANNVVGVQCDSNYKFRIQAWNSSNEYQGIWNGTTFVKANPGFYLTSIDVNKLRQTYPGFNYKIVLYASDGTSAVSLSEAVNVSYKIPNIRRLKESLEELEEGTVKVLPSVTPSSTAFDLNTETESGNRLLRGGAEGYLNAPTGFVSGGLVTFAMKDNYILQLLRDNLGNLFYRNRNVSNVWSDWASVKINGDEENDMYDFSNGFHIVRTGYRKAAQAFCLVGDNLLSCDGNGGMYVYNILADTYNALIGGNVGHGNSITYDSVNDKYYVSGWNDGNVYVVSIDFDNLTYTIDKTIDVSACGLRTTAGYVQMTQQLFVVACQSTTTIGTSYKLCLTDLDGNIQKEVSLPYSFNAVQDIHVHGLNAYVSHGMNSTYPSFIYAFNTQSLDLLDVYNFSEVYKNFEIEGVTKYDNELLVAFTTNIYRVKV